MTSTQKRVYGCIRSSDSDKKLFDSKIPSACYRVSNIKKIDLRSQSPKPQNQGEMSSCVSHGVLYANSMLYSNPQDKVDLGSRLFNYYNGRKRENRQDKDQGMSIISGIYALMSQGNISESYWKYDISKHSIQPPKEVYDLAHTLKLKSTQIPQSIFNIKNTLCEGLPIICGILIFESFETDIVTKTGIVPYPDILREEIVGRHCVVIIGFDDDQQKFIMRNSWGEEWGDQGYFYLDYKYILDQNLTNDLFCIELIPS